MLELEGKEIFPGASIVAAGHCFQVPEAGERHEALAW